MSEKIKIKIPEVLTVGEFADRLSIPVSQVIAELMKNGVMATINENIDFETAEIIAEFLDFEIEKEETKKKEKKNFEVGGKKLLPRPPIVAILGHVDHGKTSLLDKIRETNVCAGESGGITQHIGAYQVELMNSNEKKGANKNNKKSITFLDTPGHAAFEKMRAHGAQVTDIAIIIVAADDGIKQQTTEAIKHVKEAGTKMLVAINKIDKPGADPMRVRKEFAEVGINPQEWGGEVEFVDVSAKSGEGIEKLLETIIVLSEVMEIKADPNVEAQGVVIESHIETGKGPVATVLIQNGTLYEGDYIQAGVVSGKVRSMENDAGKRMKVAPPSSAVKISGFKSVPEIAEMIQAFKNEKDAKIQASKTQKYATVKSLSSVKKLDLESLSADIKKSQRDNLDVVVKADVVGSLDAIKESLEKAGNEYVGVKIASEGVGDISESDVTAAEVAAKVIIGFKVKANPNIKQLARTKGVKILSYDVIYELINDVKEILAGMMPTEIIETIEGHLKVIAIFKLSPQKTVIGGKVEDGKVAKGFKARHKRDKEVIGEYEVAGVQIEQTEAAEVKAGAECGISFSEKVLAEEGDVFEFFTTIEKQIKL